MQKAKLDILENIPDIEIAGAENEIDDVSEISLISGRKWANNKLFLFVLTLSLVVFVIAGGIWFYYTKNVSSKHEEKIFVSSEEPSKNDGSLTESSSKSGQVVPSADKLITIYYKDFIIDLKDNNGRSKILVCDVAIDVSENQNTASLVNNKDVREIIYRTAKGKSAVALRSLEERKRLKNEMAKELEKMIGEGIVKNVYFTNYIIM